MPRIVARKPNEDRRPVAARVADAIAALKKMSSATFRAGMTRFALPNERAFGVPMKQIQALAKRIGIDHELSMALWRDGGYEARMLAVYVADVAQLTSAQMDAWCRDFDNWGHCDTACFSLFDRSPHAWKKIATWSRRKDEFQKRAAFALLASVALHDKTAAEAPFLEALPMVEAAAGDERNFVRKGVSWALRGIAGRGARSKSEAIRLAKRLAASDDAAPRWIGKDVLRQLK